MTVWVQGEERAEGPEAHHQLPLPGQHGPPGTEAGEAPPSAVLLLGLRPSDPCNSHLLL